MAIDPLDQIADMQTERAIEGSMQQPLTYTKVAQALAIWSRSIEQTLAGLRKRAHNEFEQILQFVDYVEHGLLHTVSPAPLSVEQLCARASQLTLQQGKPLSLNIGTDLLSCLMVAGAHRFLRNHPDIEMALMHRYELRSEDEVLGMLVELIDQQHGYQLQTALSILDAA